MSKIAWDQTGQRLFETGVDHGVLYIPNTGGNYSNGYAWNGLTTLTETPSGAESNPQYADNTKYLNLLSSEEFGGTIEAFTYPDEFGQCDGTAEPQPGVTIRQQARKTFGLSYRTQIGNDLDGSDHGYKLHLVYGALASPSERAYTTINDSPEAIGFSWEFTCTKLEVGTIGGTTYKPVALLEIDSTVVDADALAALEDLLYGTSGTSPSLPSPASVIALFAGTITSVTATTPTYNSGTHVITVPSVTGVVYSIDGTPVTGTVTITHNTLVTAAPAPGYIFGPDSDDDWEFAFA